MSEENVAFIIRIGKMDKKGDCFRHLLRAGFLLGLFFEPEDEGDMFC
jgi:hypothetical protein